MIEVDNVKVLTKYNTCRLSIPNLKIYSPGITALIGHNGAGKSSLLKILAGFERPHEGQITYLGKNTFTEFEKLKSKIHLLSWNIEPFLALTAWDHLRLVKSLSKSWDDAAESELLKDFSLSLDKKLNKLSRGEQVKFRLLLSIPQRPQVILLDEVTNELDTETRRAIFKKLDLYSYATGAKIIFATNMIDDIERYASEIILLKQGKVILQNSLDHIKEEHKNSLEEIVRIYEKREEL